MTKHHDYQSRVNLWMHATFSPEVCADKVERVHRFFEEAAELAQAQEMTRSEAHQLVDYVWDRARGEPTQEVGGVMVTLAALCLAAGMDMEDCGEVELARCWTKIEKIRAKQAAKPKFGPLPEAVPAPGVKALADRIEAKLHEWSGGDGAIHAIRGCALELAGMIEEDTPQLYSGLLTPKAIAELNEMVRTQKWDGRSITAAPSVPLDGDAWRYWHEGAHIVLAAFNKAREAQQGDSPFPMNAEEADRWHAAKREAYQHALEMMAPPFFFGSDGGWEPRKPKPAVRETTYNKATPASMLRFLADRCCNFLNDNPRSDFILSARRLADELDAEPKGAQLRGIISTLPARDIIVKAMRTASHKGESHEMAARWITQDLNAAGYFIGRKVEMAQPAAPKPPGLDTFTVMGAMDQIALRYSSPHVSMFQTASLDVMASVDQHGVTKFNWHKVRHHAKDDTSSQQGLARILLGAAGVGRAEAMQLWTRREGLFRDEITRLRTGMQGARAALQLTLDIPTEASIPPRMEEGEGDVQNTEF